MVLQTAFALLSLSFCRGGIIGSLKRTPTLNPMDVPTDKDINLCATTIFKGESEGSPRDHRRLQDYGPFHPLTQGNP